MEDQPADSGDLTTESTDVESTDAKQAPAEPRRRWFSLRRKATAPAPSTEEPAESGEPARRTPVGKAARTAKARGSVEEATAEAAKPPAGEPTEETADADTTAGETPTDETPTDDASSDDTGAEHADAEPALVPHRPAGKRLRVGAVAAGVLFVAAAAFAGATLQPYLSDRAAVHIKMDVAQTAADAITTLWTYTPENMDKLPDRAASYLGGDFAEEYRKYIDAIVATNKQAQVTNTTEVMGAAVETLSPSEATAIVYTNSVATSPMNKNIPSLRYLSYRLTMEHRDAKWLITRMSTVTSFDLTPQL